MSGMYGSLRCRCCLWAQTVVVVVVAMALSQNAYAATLTAATFVVNPNTGHLMLVFGYDDGTLESRDWQGTLLQVRYGFGEITSLEPYRFGSSPLPRLFVGSTDSGGALRIIDPANINTDVAGRFGFNRITVLYPWWGDNRFCVGSTDSGGTLRILNSTTLADEIVRYGFGEIPADIIGRRR